MNNIKNNKKIISGKSTLLLLVVFLMILGMISLYAYVFFPKKDINHKQAIKTNNALEDTANTKEKASEEKSIEVKNDEKRKNDRKRKRDLEIISLFLEEYKNKFSSYPISKELDNIHNENGAFGKSFTNFLNTSVRKVCYENANVKIKDEYGNLIDAPSNCVDKIDSDMAEMIVMDKTILEDPNGHPRFYGYKSENGTSYELTAVLEDQTNKECIETGKFCIYKIVDGKVVSHK